MKQILIGFTAMALSFTATAANYAAQVDGVLYYGVNANGGETTGIVIQTDGGKVVELSIQDPATVKFAETLNGKRAMATGDLTTVAGVEVPDRLVLRVGSLAAQGSGVVCRSKASDYRLEFSANIKETSVYKGHEHRTTLNCLLITTFPGQYACYEKNMADAGYSVVMHDTSGVPPKAELYEVFIWGRKLIDTLQCRL